MAAHITLNHSDEEEECNIQYYLAAFTISGIDIDDTGIKKALKEFNDMDNDIVTDFFHISLSDLVDLFLDDSDKQAVLDYSRISDSEALSYFRKSTSLRGKNQESFPMKLHKILNQSETNLH